jgi:Mrp family chromosome partitioning ATPase
MIDLVQAAAPRAASIRKRRHRLDGHYEQIVSQLRCLDRADGGLPRGVGVMSLERGDGTTSISINLATSAAETGNGSVLIVDANTFRPSLHHVFGIGNAPGLREALGDAAELAGCIYPTSVAGLFVMPIGGVDNGAAGSLNLARWDQTFNDLYRSFEMVVVDLPAAEESGMGLTIAKALSGIILVLEAERSRRGAAIRVKRQLEQVGANLIGVVLNKRRHHVPNWLYRVL